ncbi:MAG: NTP transferase domain-containing protein [Bacteroidota bacterium]
MPELKTIILAAGKGTRFKSAMPKVIHCLAGKPLVHYVIDAAMAAGSLETFVVAGYKASLVE